HHRPRARRLAGSLLPLAVAGGTLGRTALRQLPLLVGAFCLLVPNRRRVALAGTARDAPGAWLLVRSNAGGRSGGHRLGAQLSRANRAVVLRSAGELARAHPVRRGREPDVPDRGRADPLRVDCPVWRHDRRLAVRWRNPLATPPRLAQAAARDARRRSAP